MESISKYIEESLSGDTEHLIEAVASRKTGKYGFPERLDIDEIVKFLENKGFHKTKEREESSYEKIYWFGECIEGDTFSFYIMFMDKRRIPKRRFFCRFDNLGRKGWVDFSVNGKKIDTFDEFRKMVCDYFGWE